MTSLGTFFRNYSKNYVINNNKVINTLARYLIRVIIDIFINQTQTL